MTLYDLPNHLPSKLFPRRYPLSSIYSILDLWSPTDWRRYSSSYIRKQQEWERCTLNHSLCLVHWLTDWLTESMEHTPSFEATRRTLPTCLKIHFNIILPSTPRSFKCFLLHKFSPPKPSMHLSFPTIRATCRAYLILLYFTAILLIEEYRLWSSSFVVFSIFLLPRPS